jgi:hypothetical protein
MLEISQSPTFCIKADMTRSSEAHFWGLRREKACLRLLGLDLFSMPFDECHNIRFSKPQRSSDFYALQLVTSKEPLHR